MLNLLKKNSLKKQNIVEAHLAVTGRFFLIISKGKIFRADQKRNPYIVNYWRADVSNYSTVLVITKIFIFLLYFTVVLLLIMRSQPASIA